MPQLNVLYWNIENFGADKVQRTRQARLGYIAAVVQAAQADIFCIEEVRQDAIGSFYLQALLQALNTGPAPYNNWYYDWIKGGLNDGLGQLPATYPFNTESDLMWDKGHQEGYAVFWNQNIAKFVMQAAPPIQPPTAGAFVNTQSGACRMQGAVTFGGTTYPLPGLAVDAAGLQVPAMALPYVLPIGTVAPGQGALAAPTAVAAGTQIAAGTVIGAGGITLNAVTAGINPVVVPGNFQVTDALTLPAAGTVLVPTHALSLVLFGRDSSKPSDPARKPDTRCGSIAATTANFVAGTPHYWNWIEFLQSKAGSATRTGCRRPAYVTVRVNRPNNPGAAAQLLPIIVYHAPAAAPASNAGMQRAAYAQPMYQAYDWANNAWIDCNNALLGADFNVVMYTAAFPGSVAYPYDAFTLAWAGGANGYGGGAGATMAVAAGGGDPAAVANHSVASITSGMKGPPLYSATLSDYRQSAIDNIFYRGLGAINAQIGDTLAASAAGGVLNGAAITGCLATPCMQAAAATGPGYAVPKMVNAYSTYLNINNGGIGALPTDVAPNIWTRRTAEFVKLFISDHLPVFIGTTM